MPPPDRCGSCTRCLDACPTERLPCSLSLDATRCISYLTIELRGSIPEELRAGIGRQVFGCDICQDVCPWNRGAGYNYARVRAAPELVNPELEWLARLTVEQFREIFRGSPVKRARFNGLRRNVAIAMGNSGDQSFLPILQQLSRMKTSWLPSHARWAVQRLNREFLDKRLSARGQHLWVQSFPVRVGITFARPDLGSGKPSPTYNFTTGTSIALFRDAKQANSK